jgi:hypothetical protein
VVSDLGEEGEGAEEGGPEVRAPRPGQARPDGGAVGDDPEGEVDGDSATAQVPRALVPRVGLEQVPEAAPHAHLFLSVSASPAGVGRARPVGRGGG